MREPKHVGIDMTSGAVDRLRNERRAAVLVLVLAVLSTLSLLALGLCHRARLELKMSRTQSDQLRAYYLAVGGSASSGVRDWSGQGGEGRSFRRVMASGQQCGSRRSLGIAG